MADQIEKDKIAVLVDADNATAALIGAIMLEIAKYGRITIKRVYGDWTTPQMNSWKNELLDNAVQPVQQFRYTVGKNATDSALIIDAMDTLNKRLVDGFCIVSSDSDFTRLATRIREEGLLVIGVGRKTTPNAFIKACDVFIHTETLTKKPSGAKKPAPVVKPAAPPAQKTGIAEPRPVDKSRPAKEDRAAVIELFRQAFAISQSNDGWVNLGTYGSSIRKIDPAFDSRLHGYARFSQMIADYPEVIEEHKDPERFPPVVYVKLKGT